MHHHESEDQAMMFLTHYCDDSGSDDASPVTAIGGPVMSKERFAVFDDAWARLLHRYRISSPLHMTDFGRPHGKCIGMHFEMKLALFSEVAELINEHKFYSVSIGIPQPDFRALMPDEAAKELTSPYALAFFLTVMLNQGLARLISDKETETSYLVDSGSACAQQLLAAHARLLKHEKAEGKFRHTGAMGFDTDDRVSALQAADVIAWSARKRQITGPLAEEFAPLNDVLDEHPPKSVVGKWRGTHAHVNLPAEGIEMWAKPIRNWLLATGKVPTLDDFLR